MLNSEDKLMGGLEAKDAREAAIEARKNDAQFTQAMQRIAGAIRGAASMKEAAVNVKAYCDEQLYDVIMDELTYRGFKVVRLADRYNGDFRISW